MQVVVRTAASLKAENINAVLIDEGVLQGERLIRLNQIAINQI